MTKHPMFWKHRMFETPCREPLPASASLQLVSEMLDFKALMIVDLCSYSKNGQGISMTFWIDKKV